METLRLHYAPDNASLVVRLALEELQFRYETILVDRSRNAQKSAAYRSINPAGKIPVLETSTGPIFETAAILLYLADQSSRLAPQADSHDRGAFLSWLFYLSNTLHTNLRLTFHPQSYVGSDKTLVEPLRDGARRALIESLHLLDDLAGASYPWLNEPQPSVLDFYLAAMLRWMALYPVDDTDWFSLSDWSNLDEMAGRLEDRNSVAALIKAEGMDPHPFTRPTFPNPTEGVAL